MPSRSVLTLAAAALLLAGCNKPSPTPEVATPDTGVVDTVAAAGAPIADSATATMDSVVATSDSLVTLPAESTADSTATN
jgi:uncharacterized lipoprotein YajG